MILVAGFFVFIALQVAIIVAYGRTQYDSFREWWQS